MKIKNTIFVNGAIPALSELMGEKLPGRTAYKLSRFAKEVDEKAKVYEAARVSLVKKYGKEDGKGGYKLIKKNTEKFQEEINELLELEEEYTQEEKIKLPKKLELAARTLILLEDVIEVED